MKASRFREWLRSDFVLALCLQMHRSQQTLHIRKLWILVRGSHEQNLRVHLRVDHSCDWFQENPPNIVFSWCLIINRACTFILCALQSPCPRFAMSNRVCWQIGDCKSGANKSGSVSDFFKILTEIGVMHWCTHTNQVELAKLAGIMQIGGIGFKDPMLLVLVTMHAWIGGKIESILSRSDTCVLRVETFAMTMTIPMPPRVGS